MAAMASKSTRILLMQEMLITGKTLNLKSYATDFNVSGRTAMRDLDELRTFYAEHRLLTGESLDIVYNRDQQWHILQKNLII